MIRGARAGRGGQVTSQASRAYASLRKDIQSGRLPSGTRLIEAELAKRLRASRTPIREALHQLQTEGLLERLPDRGVIVSELTTDAILELYEILTALEGTAARLAARLVTPLDLGRLKKIQRDVGQAVAEADLEAVINLTLAFHRQICVTAKSRYLLEFTQRIYDAIQRFKESTVTYPGRAQAIVDEHQRILDAIEARDEELAEALAREHSRKIMATRIQMITG